MAKNLHYQPISAQRPKYRTIGKISILIYEENLKNFPMSVATMSR